MTQTPASGPFLPVTWPVMDVLGLPGSRGTRAVQPTADENAKTNSVTAGCALPIALPSLRSTIHRGDAGLEGCASLFVRGPRPWPRVSPAPAIDLAWQSGPVGH